MKRSIAVIGSVGLPANYGGWETLSEQLVLNLDKTYDMTVYCSALSYAERPEKFGNAKLIYIKLKANGFQSIPYDILSMLRAYRESDVLLILGVSGCIALPFIRLLTKKAIIVNIDGFEWKRAKWSPLIKMFLKFSERLAVKYADRIVTDNKVLQDYVHGEYGVESTLIAYGGDQAIKNDVDEAAVAQFAFLSSPYAFSVCRIEPENNIHLILQAFKDNGLPLVIVGNWKQSEYGTELQNRYAEVDNLFLLDPIYDPAKLAPLRSNCMLYVHGHSAGGTNPSLVEAMWLGLPIIAFDVSFNRASTEDKAEYFSSATQLAMLAQALFQDKKKRHSLGRDMHEVADSRYRWQGIASQYDALFQTFIK